MRKTDDQANAGLRRARQLKGIMEALFFGKVVFRARLLAQGFRYRADRRSALRGQVPPITPAPSNVVPSFTDRASKVSSGSSGPGCSGRRFYLRFQVRRLRSAHACEMRGA
jgi:hypothetical protein